MKTQLILIVAALLFSSSLFAQKHYTKEGHIWFFSDAPMEDIEAHNHQSGAIVDLGEKEVVFTLLMKSFEFDKALMQEHFNEKYVHSDEYPKAVFKGSYETDQAISTEADGSWTVMVKGTMEMHGEVNDVETEATLVSKGGVLSASCKFPLILADYKIEIPKVLIDNIAEVVEVNVDVTLQPLARR